jgi:hypothetical protein
MLHLRLDSRGFGSARRDSRNETDVHCAKKKYVLPLHLRESDSIGLDSTRVSVPASYGTDQWSPRWGAHDVPWACRKKINHVGLAQIQCAYINMFLYTECSKSRFTEKPDIKTTYLLSTVLKNCSKCLPFCSISLRQSSATQLTTVVYTFLSPSMFSDCASVVVRRCSKSVGLWKKTLFLIMPHIEKSHDVGSHGRGEGQSSLPCRPIRSGKLLLRSSRTRKL